MKTIILVGIPGSGKSSILKEISRKRPSVAIVNYGDTMLRECNSAGLTRDMLRKMPIASQQEIGMRAAKKIMQDVGEITIIDTHALIRTDNGFCPGLPKEILKIVSPNVLAWIECPPSLIVQRRKGDPSRKRDNETEEDLMLHQELTHAYLSACSMETGALLFRIVNHDTFIEKNCLPFLQLIDRLASG